MSAIHHLESVILVNVDVDEHFFHALESKTGLTKLHFFSDGHRGYSGSFVGQVNLLRNLEELNLLVQEDYDAWDLLSPEALMKLKRLEINVPENREAALRNRFNQSIRRVLVNQDKESAWHSRFTA